MLGVAWGTIRSRPGLFAGSFVALALGVTMIAATGLVIASRYATAAVSRFGSGTVVVTASPVVRIPEPGTRPGGAARFYTLVLPVPPALSLAEAGRLGHLDGVARAVADRSFSVQVLAPAGAGMVTVADAQPQGHGWPSASFGPYRLAAGTPPRTAAQVVIDGRLAAAAHLRTGGTVRLLTPAGPVTAQVSGVTAMAGTTEAPVFFTAARAAQLSGTPGQVSAAVLAPARGTSPVALAAAVRRDAPGLRVLTGSARQAAEPDPASQAVAQTAGLLGEMAAVSGFVAVFVVASTFGFAVTQRRRELALLRLAGATPAQVRRMVLAEALITGLAAGAAGALAALPAAGGLLAFLRWLGVAPPRFTVRFGPWPLLIAAAIGLVVALAGAWAAARRTRKIRPAEALRQAAAEPRPMTRARWACGLACLAGGTAMLIAVPQAAGDAGLAAAAFAGEVLIIGAALLAPAITPVLAAAVTLPLTRGPLARLAGATAEVARAWLRAQPRRTASAAAPVLLLTGITGSLAALAAATGTATAADLARQVTAGVVIQAAASPPGLTAPVLRQVQSVPGAGPVAAPVPLNVYVPTRARLEDVQASGVGATVTSGTGPLRYPLTAGSLRALHGQAVAVSTQEATTLHWRPGQQVQAWLGDGTPVRLRVAAVFDAGLSGPGLLLPLGLAQTHAPPGAATAAYTGLRPGASPAAVLTGLNDALHGTGVTAAPRDSYLHQANLGRAEGENIGLTATLAMAVLYTAIAIANTLVMAVRERVRDLAQLRLAGATRWQALRTTAWEASAIAALGVLLGLAVTAITIFAVPEALRHIGSAATVAVPWNPLLAIVGACLILVLAPSIAAGYVAVRPRPLEGMGIPE